MQFVIALLVKGRIKIYPKIKIKKDSFRKKKIEINPSMKKIPKKEEKIGAYDPAK